MGHALERMVARHTQIPMRRVMPSVEQIRAIPGRDLRTANEKRLNLADRGHILGIAVATTLMRATRCDTIVEIPGTITLVAIAIGSPLNFVLTTHERNLNYYEGEKQLIACIVNGSAPVGEGARFVAGYILEMDSLCVLERVISSKRCARMASILCNIAN